MNYYEPRQVRLPDGSGGGWHYTCMNDGRVWAVGDCQGHAPHATEQEARECYARSALDTAHYDTQLADMQLRCAHADCEAWTDKMAGPAGYTAFGSDVPLCDEHRNRAGLEAVLGTVAGDSIASW